MAAGDRWNVAREEFDATCWFHITRCTPQSRFDDGLLPTARIMDRIWDSLRPIASGACSDDEWRSFRERLTNGHASMSGGHYASKTTTPPLGGPYGWLTPEIAFSHGGHKRDYFKGPEIVEDVCRCFESDFGVDLYGRFQKRSRPTIVKFRTATSRTEDLDMALVFVQTSVLGQSVTHTAFWEGLGSPIPPSDVLKVYEPRPNQYSDPDA